MKKIFIFYITFFLYWQFGGPVDKTIILNMKDLFIDDDPRYPSLRTAPDILWLENDVFIVDNKENTVINYRKEKEKLVYKKSIGRSGQGPGELFRPVRISCGDERLIVLDQTGFSFYSKEGVYINRFRIFAPKTPFVYHEKIVYYIYNNPTASYLIEGCTEKGEKIKKFGPKFLNLDYSKYNKTVNPGTVDHLAYFGVLLNDSKNIYYLSKCFGKAYKFSYDGEILAERDIFKIFSEYGEKTLEDNTDSFIKHGVNRITDGFIPANYLFWEARLLGNNIYLLSYFLKNKDERFPYIEICSINKENLSLNCKYILNLKEKDFAARFDVKEEKGQPIFLIVRDTESGFIISECR